MITPDSLLAFAIPLALIVGSLALLTKIVGIRWILSLFESEGSASLRLVGMAAIIGFSLFMRAASRLTTPETKDLLEMALGFSIVGAAKVAVSRFAPKPTVDPTQQPKPEDETPPA